MLDIGGGSLEIAIGDDEEPELAFSMPLGAGRLTREMLAGDPPDEAQVRELRRYVRAEVAASVGRIHRTGTAERAVATSKTFKQLARIAGAAPSSEGPFVSRKLRLSDLSDWLPKLAAMSAQERSELPGVSQGRAPQLVAGALVAEAAMELLEVDEVDICPWALARRRHPATPGPSRSMTEVAEAQHSVPAIVPPAGIGLTAAQVAERVAAGLTNDAPDARSRSLGDIVKANTFTWFNGLLGTLWVIMMLVAPPKQALFGLVIVFNTGIGIFQEYRASRELAKLSLIGEVRPSVIRDGVEVQVSAPAIVRDDLIVLNAGDQVVVDGDVTESRGLEIDESLLTGEADAVDKVPGDAAMSGSFIAAGSGVMVATKVGADSFAAGLTAAAKEFTLSNSELRDSVNHFIRVVSFLIVPIGILLVISQLRADQPLDIAIQGSIAGMITMIPEGLVLLTSIAMAVAVVRLARRQALVQEMPAVEALARTDVVCVDKTGTLTDPGMALRTVVPLDGSDESDINAILGALGSADPRPNPTMDAIRQSCPDPGWPLLAAVPFSSARKWSAATYEQGLVRDRRPRDGGPGPGIDVLVARGRELRRRRRPGPGAGAGRRGTVGRSAACRRSLPWRSW